MVTTRRQLDRKLLAAVERLARGIRVARQEIATDHNLSLLQLQVLEELHAGGGRRIGEIAAELYVTQPTVSDAIATLEKKGIIERSPDPADGRAVVVTTTPRGAHLAKAVAKELAPLMDDRRSTSDREQASALHVILEEIRRLQDNGMISVNRSCLSCHHHRPPMDGSAGHCLLLDQELFDRDLRVSCPDHQSA